MASGGLIVYLSAWTCLSLSVSGDVCPYKECQCVEDVIECGDLNLKALPALVVTQVSWEPYLALNDNFITNITKAGLPAGLGGIDFEGNPITRVDEDAFDGSDDALVDLKFSGVNLDELPFALFYLQNLEHLSIMNSQIRQWDESILLFLGNTLQTLTLVDAGITYWPAESMSKLTDLEFSSMPVSIPDDAFSGMSQFLSSITLRNVALTSTRNLFLNLSNLTSLVLENNHISRVTGLPNFGKLEALNLNNNSITDRTNLTDALLPVARSLSMIFLNFNKLTKFPDLSFLTNLDTLQLAHNRIYNTRFGSVPPNLTSLSLENNKIYSLSNFMRNGVKLEIVRLALNVITQIQGVDIPSSVTLIDLTSNLISEIRDTSFPLNSSMTTLTLDFNPISLVSSSAFTNLKQLTRLSMKGTKLIRLPTAIGGLNSLLALDLSASSGLVCTCVEKSLLPWAMASSAAISGDCGITSIDYFLRNLAASCPD